MNWIDLLQWPAMVVTIVAAWLIGSQKKRKREIGFWCFLVSNVLWIVWGWHDGAYALIGLQFALAFLNIRGVRKNEAPAAAGGDELPAAGRERYGPDRRAGASERH